MFEAFTLKTGVKSRIITGIIKIIKSISDSLKIFSTPLLAIYRHKTNITSKNRGLVAGIPKQLYRVKKIIDKSR